MVCLALQQQRHVYKRLSCLSRNVAETQQKRGKTAQDKVGECKTDGTCSNSETVLLHHFCRQ
jgi:hypothetical protein